LDRCRIYATDVNESVLARARNGIYRLDSTAAYEENYTQAGGTKRFSDYYQARYGHCIMDAGLREKILFAKHDLVTDGSFNDFDLILCRNVLIYFSKTLQQQVHQLLYKSLIADGVLALGQKETLRHLDVEECYRPISVTQKLFQKLS
jgi:chemotaxis protein methyltransferase CheR